jgi:hypothetical protein
MSQTYGIEAKKGQAGETAMPPARYLVLVDSAAHGGRLARLFLASREEVAEFDASAPEVLSMTQGLVAAFSANEAVWDEALGGHSVQERAAAQIFTLDV